MKKVSRIALAALLVFPLVFSACTTDPENPDVVIYGHFSWPVFFIHEGGTLNIADWEEPIEGGVMVDDATITVTNTTTGESNSLVWVPPDEYHPVGYYALSGDDTGLEHSAGQSVSVQINALGNTYTGGPTVTSDAYTTLSAPEYGSSVSQPFDVTWTNAQETTAATHILVSVTNFSIEPEVLQSYVLPITATSQQISGLPVGDNYSIFVEPANRMEITGGGTTNYAYVYSTSSRSSYVMVNITAGGGN